MVDRQVAEGRVASGSEFLLEAARRLAEEIALEDDVVAEAKAGIVDAEAGRFTTVITAEDEAALHERTMARLHERLAADRGRCPVAWSAMRNTGSTTSCSTVPGAGASLLRARCHRLILAAAAAIGDTPALPGSREVPRLDGLRTFRFARGLVAAEGCVASPRHLLVYRVALDSVVEVLGIVHDHMQFPRCPAGVAGCRRLGTPALCRRTAGIMRCGTRHRNIVEALSD